MVCDAAGMLMVTQQLRHLMVMSSMFSISSQLMGHSPIMRPETLRIRGEVYEEPLLQQEMRASEDDEENQWRDDVQILVRFLESVQHALTRYRS